MSMFAPVIDLSRVCPAFAWWFQHSPNPGMDKAGMENKWKNKLVIVTCQLVVWSDSVTSSLGLEMTLNSTQAVPDPLTTHLFPWKLYNFYLFLSMKKLLKG